MTFMRTPLTFRETADIIEIETPNSFKLTCQKNTAGLNRVLHTLQLELVARSNEEDREYIKACMKITAELVFALGKQHEAEGCG